MAENIISLDTKNLAKKVKIVVKLKHFQQFKLRLWLVEKLLHLAKAISWTDFTIEQSDGDSLEDAIKEFGNKGIVISIAYGPMKDKGNMWSVNCLDDRTKDSFKRPYTANSLDHCLEIANLEIAKRGWLEEKPEV